MRCTGRMHASPRSLHVHKLRISPRHTDTASPTALEHISSSTDKMPRDPAANQARHFARIVRRRAAQLDRAGVEQGDRVPEGTGKVQDSSHSLAEDAGMFNCSEYLALN